MKKRIGGGVSVDSGTIQGRLAAGVSRGRHFTRLDWARRQLIDKLGIDPFPGTVNVTVDDPGSLAAWNRLKESRGVLIDNPNDGPHDCSACCYPVSIGGCIDAAIVLPLVRNYPPNKIEVISATGIRGDLSLADGDPVTLEIKRGDEER